MPVHELIIANPSRRRGRNAKGRFIKGHARAARTRRRRSTYLANPTRRRRHHHRVAATHHRRRRRMRHFLSNPARRQSPMAMFTELLAPAGYGTAGAIATDMAVAYLPIGANYKTGVMGVGLKTLLAVLVGWGASFAIRPRHAAFLAAGGIIKPWAEYAEQLMHQHLPSVKLGEYQPAFPAAYEAPPLSAGAVGGLGAYEGANSVMPYEAVMV
ncbi:MAG: hypothetical protein ACYCUI_11590 [Vulcanimicrobiaceae bacterium]